MTCLPVEEVLGSDRFDEIIPGQKTCASDVFTPLTRVSVTLVLLYCGYRTPPPVNGCLKHLPCSGHDLTPGSNLHGIQWKMNGNEFSEVTHRSVNPKCFQRRDETRMRGVVKRTPSVIRHTIIPMKPRLPPAFPGAPRNGHWRSRASEARWPREPPAVTGGSDRAADLRAARGGGGVVDEWSVFGDGANEIH